MKLNLGCGNRHEAGYVNVDVSQAHRPDKVWDLNRFPYPWADGSIDEVKMRHVLEHLDDLIKVMDEVWRILGFGRRVYIEVPYVTHFQAIGHPQHKHFFHWGTFGWLDVAGRGRGESYTNRYFRILRNRLVFDSYLKIYEEMFNKYPTVYNNTTLAKLFPAASLDVVLEKVK